jgi:hypothetical protein
LQVQRESFGSNVGMTGVFGRDAPKKRVWALVDADFCGAIDDVTGLRTLVRGLALGPKGRSGVGLAKGAADGYQNNVTRRDKPLILWR